MGVSSYKIPLDGTANLDRHTTIQQTAKYLTSVDGEFKEQWRENFIAYSKNMIYWYKRDLGH